MDGLFIHRRVQSFSVDAGPAVWMGTCSWPSKAYMIRPTKPVCLFASLSVTVCYPNVNYTTLLIGIRGDDRKQKVCVTMFHCATGCWDPSGNHSGAYIY